MSGIQKAGYKLAAAVLTIIGIFILFLIGLFLFTDLQSTITPENKDHLDWISQEKKDYREFILDMTQLILLNLLLPTLTAILGYIFGSNEDKSK